MQTIGSLPLSPTNNGDYTTVAVDSSDRVYVPNEAQVHVFAPDGSVLPGITLQSDSGDWCSFLVDKANHLYGDSYTNKTIYEWDGNGNVLYQLPLSDANTNPGYPLGVDDQERVYTNAAVAYESFTKL